MKCGWLSWKWYVLRFVWKLYAVMLDKQNDCSSLRWHERLIIVKYLNEKINANFIVCWFSIVIFFFEFVFIHSKSNIMFTNFPKQILFILMIYFTLREKKIERQQTTSNLLMIHDVIMFLMGDIRFKWIWRFSSYQFVGRRKSTYADFRT